MYWFEGKHGRRIHKATGGNFGTTRIWRFEYNFCNENKKSISNNLMKNKKIIWGEGEGLDGRVKKNLEADLDGI